MQRNRRWQGTLALLALLLLIAGPALAQTFRGSINGTVTDSSGAVIPNVKVTATDVATGVVRETVSSGAGEFLFNDLPSDTYTVKASAQGFQNTVVTGVQVLAGKIYTLPVKMSIAQQATTVEVAADALALDTTTVTQTVTLATRALQDTPLNGRNFLQLVGTSASFAGYSSGGSVNGMRGNQVNYTIDGTDNNDLYLNAAAVNQGSISGIAGVTYPIDALEEYSLQTTGNSESGRSPGGNLNVTTKSGSNQLHGDAYYYNRNEALAVVNPFTAPGAHELPLRNQQFGASLGGPIRRDHTFFFLLYEEQKYLIGAVATTTEPSPAYENLALAELKKYGVTPSQVSEGILSTMWDQPVIANLPGVQNNFSTSAPETGYSHNVVAHLDHNFSDKSHLSAIWYWGQGNAAAPSCVNVCSDLPEYFQTVPSHIQNYNLTWNYALRPSLANQVSAGVSYFTQDFYDAVDSQNPLTLAGLNTGQVISGAPAIDIEGFDGIGTTPTSGRNDISGQLGDILSWTVGKHQVRFGVEYRRAYIDLYYDFGGRGTFNFGTGPTELGPWASDTSVTDPNVLALADFMAGYAYTSDMTLGVQERFLYTHTGSAFAEDSWQVTPKLNLDLGLRYDYQQPFYTNSGNLYFDPTTSDGLVVAGGSGEPPYIYNSNKLDYSPRFGFSYQVSNGLVLRGNYGIYYDQPAGQAFFGNIGIVNGGSGGANNNPVGTEPNESIVLNAPSPVTPVWTYNQSTPVFTPSEGQPTGSNIVSIYSVNRNFKTPYAELFGLNIEQSLGNAWMLNIGYVGSASRHNLVIEDINQNALGGDQNTSKVTGPNGGTFSYQQSVRPYFQKFPNFSIINQVSSAASSSYNALQVTLRSSSWHGLSSQFAYAWSHNLDDSSSFSALPQNSFNLKGDWGNASADIRNHFAGYLDYAIPALAKGPKALTQGWDLNSILKFQNGEPVNVRSGKDNSGTAEEEDRASLIGSPLNSNRSIQSTSSGSKYVQYFNRSSFAQPANGTYGNMSRDELIGPGYSDVDMSLIKNTPIYKERVSAQFRVEMYNVFNRLNLPNPGSSYGSASSFGKNTSTIGTSHGAPGIGAGEPYNTQLAMKIIF